MGKRGPVAIPGRTTHHQGGRSAASAAIIPIQRGGAIVERPPARRTWLAETRKDWRNYLDSEVARAIASVDYPALYRLFELRDRSRRAMDAVREEPLDKGSKAQARVSPLLEWATKIEPTLLRLENEFGLTPMSRARLGIELGTARKTLEDVNRRYASDRNDDASDDADPRLAAMVESHPDPRRADAT